MPINRQNLKLKIFNGFLVSFGLVDQLEDRCLCKAEALGSSPSKSIFVHPESNVFGEGLIACAEPQACEVVYKCCILDAYWTWLGIRKYAIRWMARLKS